jgi:hypothetical protein
VSVTAPPVALMHQTIHVVHQDNTRPTAFDRPRRAVDPDAHEVP